MLQLYIFLVFISHSLVVGSPRIVHGQNADEGEFPFAVSIRDKYNQHFCGGTILNENHILTAAHCFCDEIKPESPFSIQYGSVNISSDDTRSIRVGNVSCNENFYSDNQKFDVAVLQLETAIPEGKWTSVKLAKEFKPSLLTKGTIIGWGMRWNGGGTSKVLQKLEVSVLLDDYCGLKFDTDHHICTSSLFSGACNGDSGSPLMVSGVQVGIASFITTNCEGTSVLSPNIYARISKYIGWIEALENI